MVAISPLVKALCSSQLEVALESGRAHEDVASIMAELPRYGLVCGTVHLPHDEEAVVTFIPDIRVTTTSGEISLDDADVVLLLASGLRETLVKLLFEPLDDEQA